MKTDAAIAIVGTFDSKGEEHLFLKRAVQERGLKTLTINLGTKAPSPFLADFDLYQTLLREAGDALEDRDRAISAILQHARRLIRDLYDEGKIGGILSCGGGTGTHLGTNVMSALPLGVPKVMLSTVASRDMAKVVGTKDIAMIHTVVDLLGVNSISGGVLDRAAAAVCGMAESRWKPAERKKGIALTLFGFVTEAAEHAKRSLEAKGYEVIPFHANGTGGMAMEELAAEGRFVGILDLATHELADALKGGYCGGIGPGRLEPVPGKALPRLVVPGGLDCAVLEFDRKAVPSEFKDRKIFFYDFRSAVRLSREETIFLASQIAGKLNRHASLTGVLLPMGGWSEADRVGAPLYDPDVSDAFAAELKRKLSPRTEVRESPHHINDPAFGQAAAAVMDAMVRAQGERADALH